jgi:hypothetical protein
MLRLQVVTVASKQAATFTVEFLPEEVGSFSHELQLRVNNNPFEQYRVAVTGVCRLLVSARLLSRQNLMARTSLSPTLA